MHKQSIIDETQILQMHEGQARQLLHLWQDGRIHLDYDDTDDTEIIEPALTLLGDILDRSIRARNQQTQADTDPRHERGYFGTDRL